jgi:hypothetical protein
MFKLPGIYAARVWGEIEPPFRNKAKLVTLKDLSKTVGLSTAYYLIKLIIHSHLI